MQPDTAKRQARRAPQQASIRIASVGNVAPSRLPAAPGPQLATRVDVAPSGDGWLHEIKFDGYRLMARISGSNVRLLSRNGNDWTERFPVLVKAFTRLSVEEALIDGELVALQSDGTSSFRQLQEALAAKRTKDLVFEAFDLIHLDGYVLTEVELATRKKLLKSLLANRGTATNRGPIRYVQHFEGKGAALFEEVCSLGLEGIVCKRRTARYRSGRTTDWLKMKCVQQAEFVVGGYTKPSNARSGFGALLLGAYTPARQLRYVGSVGTGFSAQQLRNLHRVLRKLESERCPFDEGRHRDAIRGVHWVRPELVADVEYSEWTRDGMLRHPVFRGIREDREPGEIELGMPAAPVATRSRPATPPAPVILGATRRRAGDGVAGAQPRARRGLGNAGIEVAGVRLTHPDRVLYPDQGVTKLHLARHYAQAAPWMLPHVTNRPLAVVRCPEGSGKPCFYQKHPPEGLPEAVGRVRIRESGGEATHLYVESLAGIVALVQMGALELHCWGSRVDLLERPDLMVFDLDPGPSVEWTDVIRGARELDARLAALGLRTFPKLTGGTGLHLVVPLERRHEWDEIKQFARAVAEASARERPDRFTAQISKAKRQGKIFIDYLRNGRGATAVASYSTRARQGAAVAVPISWDELSAATTPDRYTVETLPRRVAELSRDPWEGFERARATLTPEMCAVARSR